MQTPHYDWLIVGSGFGGSVSALRLAEKGYRVLVVEKGRRYAPSEFPKSNWDLSRWMWMPQVGLRGIFQMSFMNHATILHGVGVGGGSLVYANTLPTPKDDFFRAPSWAHLADFKRELEPHYRTARRMLGAATNPLETRGDRILKEIAQDMGRPEDHHPTDVAVFFGKSGRTVPDPYFGGEGPDRTGCTFCGACMTGCRVGAKNTLDKNYLFLAEKRGVVVQAETEVLSLTKRVRKGGGFVAVVKDTFGGYGSKREIFADRVVLSGGVMGTIPLLLRMREDPNGLPALSERVGKSIRTNSEAVLGVISSKHDDFAEGVAITSILHTDDHSHIEPVRYGRGSGFFRLLTLPHAPGPTVVARLASASRGFFREPGKWIRALAVRDFARHSQVLLYMRTVEGTLTFELGRNLFTGWNRKMVSRLDATGVAPSAFMPEATDLAQRFADKVSGVSVSILTETMLGTPTTAHVLGGACMGSAAEDGVIDAHHRVFGYDGLYVVDGASVSANPGVNPSLTITAMAERAMSFIAPKG